ncbi:PKD domain-containing protein [Ramlibacter montanisoli]|uniref:PKD domain-containing protein n=1 Tax=Ramlibacter montanisoli TaxID=2732512 RepID=A0A849KF49_9BURK|nr:PKD domain-containing protein [Ramlibacter montanisoli]NNU44096.1 hypothetical protein [Ramlibacter montanisoli]
MKSCPLVPALLVSVLAACGGGGDDASSAPDQAAGAQALQGTALAAPMYAVDFVAPAASGNDLNDAGHVVGKSHPDPGCGPFCLPAEETVLWKGGERIVLPTVPGADANSQYPMYINNSGLIAGMAGVPGSATRAVVWLPGAGGYSARDLGVFPGTSSVDVGGLDEQGRLVGWATLGGAIPSIALPFMWTQAAGMVDLRAMGYPNERPLAMSPGGKVVTWGFWYQLGEPRSAKALPPPPQGFMGVGSNGSVINDDGDQAHFLVTTGSQNLVYPFRLTAGGGWQQLTGAGTGRLSRARMGAISAGQDVSFTAQSTGMVAPGPAGLGQPLAARMSPAYPGATVTDAGAMNAAGQVLSQVMIGRSQRLVKLTPVSACASNCLVSSSLVMTGQFVQDPALPGSCVQGGRMHNLATAAVTIRSETGTPLANVKVSGRFLDDYWTNQAVTGTTDASGVVRWSHKGLCGAGAIAFFVDSASLEGRTLDRTRGTLTGYVIPGATSEPLPAPEPAPVANVAPVAQPAVNCTAGRACSFTASGSYDPDGSITAYRWAESNGTTWSTQAVFTKTFGKAGRESVVLHVTDNGGLVASKKLTFTVQR